MSLKTRESVRQRSPTIAVVQIDQILCETQGLQNDRNRPPDTVMSLNREVLIAAHALAGDLNLPYFPAVVGSTDSRQFRFERRCKRESESC
jgi:hypothetical protein